jgi:hypothetical protein
MFGGFIRHKNENQAWSFLIRVAAEELSYFLFKVATRAM